MPLQLREEIMMFGGGEWREDLLVVSAPGRFRWGKQQHEEEVDLFIGIKR